MKYVSTRGTAPVLEFGDVLLTGLARDGGLYLPESWPVIGPDALARFADLPYADIAVEVMWPFVEGGSAGALDRDRFAEIVAATYATFDDPEVTPLRDLGDGLWLMELFHGPTLAFKDVALQLVGRLFDHELAARGDTVTIVGATSGDTGSAAIEACRDREAIEVFIMHPAGRVSDVQRRQMTTVDSPNIHNIAVEGTFDDCQDLVKALFADVAFRDRRHLGAVNSINWARVLAQVVYYVVGSARLTGGRSPVAYSVPTGNFGNVFAGYAAQRMGTPISQFVVGSNENDILARFLETGAMHMTGVHPTLSPSMDIQISSNFERLLFELYGRDGAAVVEAMARVPRDRRVPGGRGPPRPAARAVVGCPGRRCRHAGHHRRDPRAHRRGRRPAHRGRPRCRRGLSSRPGGADDLAGHGPPGQVPRCRGVGHRDPSGAARAPRRPLRAARAPGDAAERPRRGARLHRRHARLIAGRGPDRQVARCAAAPVPCRRRRSGAAGSLVSGCQAVTSRCRPTALRLSISS